MASELNVKWPALLFWRPNDGIMRVDRAADFMRVQYRNINCSRSPHENLILIDSDGTKLSLHDECPAVTYSCWSKLAAWVTNRVTPTRFDRVVECGTVSTDELRELVLEDIDRHYDFWIERVDFEEMLESIKNAISPAEIISVL